MKNGINGYAGLNKDVGLDTIQNTFYIDALNIRISTTKGESQGSVTNIEGNSFYFNIPQQGRFPDEPGGTSWNADNAEIIGATSIRDKIILFVADDNFQGWIYEIDYNETDCTFNGRTLKYYSADLNFRKEWPIEAVGRYESGCYRRIYWSDYNNPFRSLNLEADDLDTLPVGLIDTAPDVTWTMPLLTNVLGGGALTAGLWQYAYRLITTDGKRTLISPGGNLIHTVSDTESEIQSARYNGDLSGVNTGKAHEITIDTSNYLDFKDIELIALYYEDLNGTPTIYSIEEKSIANQNQVIFTHTGVEDTITVLENFEYSLTELAFKTIKTLTPKDNSLVVANIKGGSFDIQSELTPGETFDAKVIRYLSDGTTPSPSGAFNTEYNKDAHWDTNWHDNEQYKYQTDGTTLGGESIPNGLNPPNISFKFHLEPFYIDGEKAPGFANLANVPTIPTPDLNDGYSYANTTYPSQISPFITGVLRGYKRGETYRFGIIFYNKKGEASFVEYIGDIKFPDISEEDGSVNSTNGPYFPISREVDRVPNYDDGGVTSNMIGILTEGYALGIEFTLDLSSCLSLLDKISGYQIVRVKRENTDKRRLCSGIIKTGYLPQPILDTNSSMPDFREPSGDDKIVHLFAAEPTNGFNGTLLNLQAREDSPWDTVADGTPRIRGEYIAFHSPEISFEFNNELAKNTILSNGNSGLLITGLYAQYPSVGYKDAYYAPGGISTDSPAIEIFPTATWSLGGFQNFANQADYYSYKVEEAYYSDNNANNDFEEELGYLFDLRRKPRTVIPVLKDSGNRNVEYLKRWQNKTKSTFTNVNQEDDVLLENEFYGATHNLGTSFPFRNYYAYSSYPYPVGTGNWNLNNGASMGRTNSNTLSASVLAKGATCVLGNIESYKNDPLTQGTISNPTADFFNANNQPTSYPTSYPIAAKIPYTGFNYPFISGGSWQLFEPTTPSDIDRVGFTSIPVVDLIIPKQEIYGGATQDAVESNTFIPASPFIDKVNIVANQHTFRVYGGDIFLSMWTFQENTACLDRRFYDFNEGNYGCNLTTTTTFVVESEINIGLSFGSTIKTGVGRDVISSTGNNVRWRQETLNSETDYGKLTEDSRRNMYVDSYNEAYSREKDDLFFFVKPEDFNLDCNTNDIRAYISNVKINEELIDSWTQFGVNNYYDVDDYGPINKILNWRDTVYFFQDKGVGAYSINPRAVVTATDGIPTELGSGEGFQDHQYFSNEHGSIHQWAVKSTETGIYYYDAVHNKIFKVSEGNQPLSELLGLHGFLNEFKGEIFSRKEQGGDNPILGKGAHITRDKINDEVLFTFLGTNKASELGVGYYYPGDIIETSEGVLYEFFEECNVDQPNPPEVPTEEELIQQIVRCANIIEKLPNTKYTVVYDELAQRFSSFYSATPPIYIENGNILLSPNPDLRQNVYVHNKGNFGEFYGNVEESSISIVINHQPDINKVLRFIEFNSIVRDRNKNIDREQTITSFRIHNEYQDTGIVPFSTGRIKRRFDKWRLKIPRDTNNQRSRLRSTYFILTLYFDNSYNKELILNRIVSHFDLQIY